MKHILFVYITCRQEYICIIPYQCNALICLSFYTMCFHCVFPTETYTLSDLQMNTRIHMYYTLYMNCTDLLVFSCVFTLYPLQKHRLFVHFTCIQEYTCTIPNTCNALRYNYYVFNTSNSLSIQLITGLVCPSTCQEVVFFHLLPTFLFFSLYLTCVNKV
jgi:hypothetical protein